MRVSLQAILLVPVFNAAFVAPSVLHLGSQRRDLQSGPIVAINGLSRAEFKVPCPGCWGAGNEELLLDIEVFPSVEACGFGNASVNGYHLSTEESSPISGQDTFPVKRASDGSDHNLTASWNFDCLYDIYNYSGRIGNQDRPIAQALLFQFLTLDGTHSIDSNRGFTFSFIQSPGAELIRLDTRLWPSGPFMASEWSDLDHLGLSQMFPDRPSHVHDAVSLPVPSPCPKAPGVRLGKELEQCQTIKCALRAVLRKARGAVKTICLKIRPPPSCGEVSEELKSTHRPWKTGAHQSFREWRNGAGHDNNQGLPSHHGLPPRHGFYYRFREISLHFKVLISIILLALLVFAFYKAVSKCHSHRHSCAQHRALRRAQRRSRREARAARRAACREAWRSWWRRRFRHRSGIDDSDEKRARVAPQEAILETAMQSEIRGLREAANMVSNLIAAEEGRGHLHQLQRTTSFGSEASLPSYRSRASEAGDESPPGYDENGADDIVADGFQYTPTATTWTPDSSVVGSPKIGYDDSDEYGDM